MLPCNGLCIRGYRPGGYGAPGLEETETLRLLKMAKIEVYASRARAHLPIFEEDQTPVSPHVGRGGRPSR
jgi:hypothetical protein